MDMGRNYIGRGNWDLFCYCCVFFFFDSVLCEKSRIVSDSLKKIMQDEESISCQLV